MSTDRPSLPDSYDTDIAREPDYGSEPEERRRCELTRDGLFPCSAPAAFHVQIGTRRYDGQDSCRRHLTATADVLLQAEDRPVTVTRIREG